ncbi:arf-GAP with Rho-GAP domain, ANK repeat and PH domain-containing protein 1 [Sitophilus oryzae]|uniref:Arf-GAP with Rho-GAP domain, ANK repeat and PH domain-containing protein 1 n=1 Tax=Sitophilus oryzae TaxID=7048 RepID=A0A6J2YH77_SITOR|nr:arf-GAP with Rho-GAP domain, ANK repeat and PH domain-containing protein 1 [Sitophilus oryzae]
MERPIPAPREFKKPVPAPRKNINRNNQRVANLETNIIEEPFTEIAIVEETKQSKISEDKGEQFNTFSRRVTNASKQIAGDIGQLVQGRKKAVIEGTRQSVRRLTRKFSSASQLERKHDKNSASQQDLEVSIDIFNNIKFESPISRANSIYSNIENELESGSSDESLTFPPPKHPPPPLPAEGVYDAPSSSPVTSSTESSTSGRNQSKTDNYESIFPQLPQNNNNLNSDNMSSSCSWKYYDTVNQQENIYDNIGVKEENSHQEEKSTASDEQVLIPAKVENTHRVSNASSMNHTNSIYENHEVVFLRENKDASNSNKTSKSVLMQFDPLTHLSSTQFSELNLLEDLLQGDLYGSIPDTYRFDEFSISNDSEPEEYLNPPTPPLRIDSLPGDEVKEESEPVINSASVEKVKENDKRKSKLHREPSVKSRTNWFDDTSQTDSTEKRSPVEPRKNWLKQVLEKTPDVFKTNKPANSNVERPILGGSSFISRRGMLYKVQSGPVEDFFGEYSGRWCVLENNDLVCYSDNTCSSIKEHFPASNILSIQLLQDPKYKYRHENDDLHCFELNVTGKSRGGHKYGSRSMSERRIWMQHIAEMLTQKFKSRYTSNFIRMGWAYVREGVSGKWAGAWLILSERELHYVIDRHSVKTMDLRKARCIILQAYEETQNIPRTNDKGPNMLVDCPDLTLYLRMWTSRETKVWCHIVKLEAHNNGANLDQQQLTKNDIPVIVEKCINFIYAHGSMSEGIYRKPGTGSVVSDLLFKFRKDAFAVQLTKNLCSEYEVATALKRFFRELPEPLFGSDHRQYLYEVAKHNIKDEKIRMFKAALDQLPTISYKTSRKLLGHLHFISLQSSKNLMDVDNLAAIWGPTLMHYDDKDRPSKGLDHVQDAEVVSQLIRHYRNIFPEDPGELEKEKVMLKILQKYTQSPQGSVNDKAAGDFRVWIYLFSKEGKAYNLAIGPNRTAYEVCMELCDKIGKPALGNHEIILEEVVLDDRLVRPIHHTEKVLDVVLKWSYWDDADRKNNYITCVSLSKYWEYIIEKPLPVSGELKFADSKSRVFRTMLFQFTQGCLSCFKDKTSDASLFSWHIEDLIWYLGHEPKRHPPSKYTMTFFKEGFHPKRTRNHPFFGNVVVWNDAGSRANWISAMLKSRSASTSFVFFYIPGLPQE